MAERMTAAQAERDQAREEAGKAREEAARLAGRLESSEAHSAGLLARLDAIAQPVPEKKPTRTTR